MILLNLSKPCMVQRVSRRRKPDVPIRDANADLEVGRLHDGLHVVVMRALGDELQTFILIKFDVLV